jgi:hypothetical protein
MNVAQASLPVGQPGAPPSKSMSKSKRKTKTKRKRNTE